MISRTTAAIAATFALALAALPATAGADSILYSKDGDVWAASPGGQDQTRISENGGYMYVSQSERGTVAAVRGNRIHVLSRAGEILRDVPTVVGGSDWYGPFELDLSPDGSKIAYEVMYDGWGLRTSVAYAATASGEPIGDVHTGWGYPTWIDDSALILSGAPNALSEDTILRRAGEPNNVGRQWFSHTDVGGIRDGDVTRAGDKMAFVGGEDDQYLLVYRFSGEPGVDLPEYCYHYEQPVGKFRDPSFSPDGTQLAWEEGNGINVASIPNLSGGCATPSEAGSLRIPGGSFPDWAGADVPGPEDGKAALRLAGKPKLRRALKKGLPLRVSGLPDGTALAARVAKGVARLAGLGRKAKVVARGEAAAGRATLRFPRPVARKLGRLKALPLTVSAPGASLRVRLVR